MTLQRLHHFVPYKITYHLLLERVIQLFPGRTLQANQYQRKNQSQSYLSLTVYSQKLIKFMIGQALEPVAAHGDCAVR